MATVSPPQVAVKEEALEDSTDFRGAIESRVEVVEPTSPDTAMAEVKMERSPGIRIAESPPPPPPTTNAPTLSPPTPASSSSAYAKSPAGSPAVPASSPPSLPSPPLLFQPFLPSNKNAAKSPLPFSIDNILKPTFGHSLQLLQTVAVAAAAAAQRQQQRERQSHHSFFPGEKTADLTSNPGQTVPSSIGTTATNGTNINNNRPVDLSRSKPTVPEAAPEKKPDSSSSPLPLKKEDDSDCPPGMVRGPNGQLWPAWVFCTRYSDRPSSGE